ncbi:LOW QUALITY PROTEIN: tenascin-like [Lampris incognitus]|uniref:LOW QUALITY PROTEIN: tenascin-like n=1 Tax=Lampris incognitus TaxID=2546036 RepID=UPI0024B4DFE7|nr:LOW QUALITY PROTEIN: tenascin-like [Lampris incognitus]
MGPKGLLGFLLLISSLTRTDAGLVKNMLRQRRQTTAPSEEHTIGLSSADQPVVFKHVYNINVPASSMCSVDLDPPKDAIAPSDVQNTEGVINKENQIVFTHRINIPRQACGCTDNMPELKDLLNRLEMLEGEISVLRDQCSGDTTCCSAQVTGEVGTKPYCYGHGNYSADTCSCVCEPGWRGPNCTEAACPGDCRDRGRCVDGKCECFEGFAGDDCAQRVCPVDCGANGRCQGGACVCSEGFFGDDCSQTKCLNNCLGRGRCVDEECVCDEPWTGYDCSELICPKDCYDRGRCVNGTCYCDDGYAGEDCATPTCPSNCRRNGFCVDGKCVCSAGYAGEDCSVPTCLNDCSGRGTCYNGVCICEAGYQGEDCSQLACLNNCNSRGQCINGRCACDVGFQGDDCDELSCPGDCSDRGRCVNGQCVCAEGFAGEDCGVKTCPSNCHGRGDCVDGRCLCFGGFAGEDCGALSCPGDCRNRGRCVDGQCVCDEGFAGEDCSRKACPNDCLGRGRCLDGQCACEEGFSGDDCSVLSCPENCSGRGRCVVGSCVCEEGYEGDSCGDLSCVNNCQGRGRCVNGRCVCEEGYVGEDCSDVSPPKDLTISGVTNETMDLSWKNEMLVTEYLVTYVPNNPGGLHQDFTVSGDQTAATIKELEPGIEYLINVYAILNNRRSIPVIARVATYLPQPEGLKFKSVRETSVEVLWDPLDTTFDGWELYFRNTKEENGKIVNILPSSQKKFDQSGLAPGQEYEVSLSVIKNNTRGPQTSKKITTKIDGPRHVDVKDVTDSSTLVTWSQPVAEVDGVTVFYGPSSDTPDQTRVDFSSSEKQYNIDNLRPDTEYQISLVSRRGDTTSNPVTLTFTTDLDAPRDLRTLSQTDDSITLEWSNSLADVDSYKVKYSPISGGPHGEDLFPRGRGPKTQATITGLKPGTEYGIGVTAVKSERESLPATTNAATALDPPRDLERSGITETTLTLAWKKPRAKITHYRLVYVSRDGKREELEVPAPATSYVLRNLTPGMAYSISLTAERGQKKSDPATISSSTASFTFYLADSDVPELSTPSTGSEHNVISFVYLESPDSQSSGTGSEDEHGALTISGLTSNGFDVSWKPRPLGVYDRFTVECKDTQQLWDMKEVQLHGDATGAKIRGLKASTEYQIKLYGITNSQRSTLLEAVAVTAPIPTPPDVIASTNHLPTPSALDTRDAQTTAASGPKTPERPGVSDSGRTASGAEPERSSLGAFGELVVTNVTSTRVRLAWSAPGEAFDGFLVELKAPSGRTQSRVTTVPGSVRSAEIEGLFPSTRYDITLYGLVEGERSLPLKLFATTEEPMPMVMNLTISDITWDSFNVSWSPTDGEYESFVIEVTNLEQIAESQNLTVSGDASSLGISGLNPNTSYMVALYGMHQGSFLEPVYTEATTVSEPVVGKLYVSNLTSESFSISWNSTGGEFDGYVLEIIDSDWLREPEEYNISGNVMSHAITGLRPSTDYVVYLYGILNGSRTNAISIVASTAAEPDLSRLAVSNITSDRFTLSWRTGEKDFDNFVIEVRESALPSQAVGRTLPGNVRSTVMAGLKESMSYNIKLYASTDGQNTQPIFAVATTEDVPQLGAISASSVNPHNLTLSWSTISGHFDGFVVRVSDSEQLFETLEFRVPGDVLNITVSNLVDATGYDIELYGISHGRRTPSVLAHVITAPLPKVENLTISNVTPYGFRVSWEFEQQQEGVSTSGAFSHFHIVVTDSGWLLKPHEFTVPGNQSHLDIWGLITGIGYEVRLTGVSRSGLLSRPLTTVAVTEAEAEIEHLFVSDITADSFRLSWTADEDLFDRFVIKIRDTKKFAHPREFNVLGDQRTKVLTGLMDGTEYEIELYGVTLEQRSQPITGVAQTGLGSPRGIRFSEVTDTSALVHWTTPHSQVDGYRIIYVPLQGGSPMTLTVDGTVSQALLSNMMPGKTYQVTVTAVKGLEESDPSRSSVTTDLDRPQGLAAVNVTDTSALLLWQPSVATVDGYVITYSTDSVSPVIEHVSGNTVEFEMGSLVPATHYKVGMYAMKDAQKSASATTEFTTDVDPPRDLVASNIQTDSATLTWKPPRAAVTGYMLTFSSADGTVREVVLSPTATSYSMSQLTGSTEYSVRLHANVGAQRSRHVSTVFITIGKLYQHPQNCAQAFLNGETASGLYTIYVGGEESQSVQVYCDMTTDGGGWLVFLRRQNGKLEFFRNWKNYTNGFGNMNDEFWLGLSNLHKITASGQYELRVDLGDGGESAYAQYDKFTIAEPRTRYKVNVGAYSGTAGDSMTYHQGRPFSTYDNDNDIAVTNCALSYKGAFWYKNCHRVNLMGKYGDDSHSKGINWFHWKGHEHSIEFAEMKIRPVNFKNFESRRKRS